MSRSSKFTGAVQAPAPAPAPAPAAAAGGSTRHIPNPCIAWHLASPLGELARTTAASLLSPFLMGLSQHGYLVLCYCLCVAVLVGVAAFALVASYLLRRRTQTADDFITARGQASKLRTWERCFGRCSYCAVL